MSEADQHNNQSLPEPTVPSNHSEAELSTEKENLKIVKFSELPDLKPPVQPWKPDETTQLDAEETAFLTNRIIDEDETADDSEQKSSQDAGWFALAQKMRQRNRNLQDEVNQLKGALKQKQEALNSEQTRSQQQETLLAQQAEEFNTLHEQLTRLFKALEASHQASQRQQILIETLSEQLQSSSERIAQLERECALTQQRHNEQSHQLIQAANTCRELRSRLQRQQQQTLQFKAALEKSLEMPVSPEVPQSSRSSAAQPFVPKAQPIRPWSAESEALEEPLSFDTIWKHPVKLEPPQPVYFAKTEPFEIRRLEEPNLPNPEPDLTQSTLAQELPIITPAPDSVLNLAQETTDTELELESQLLAEMSSLAEAAGLGASSEVADNPKPYLLSETRSEASSDLLEPSFWGDSQEAEAKEETPLEEAWGDASTPEPAVVLPQSNWPSPVLYPLRPPKKRKSLGAIDLPSFPRFYPT